MYLFTYFLLSANSNRLGKLINDLQNEYGTGHEKYPETLNDAYNLILNRKQNKKHS